MSEFARELVRGFARLADLSGKIDPDLGVRPKSDAEAMREDWDAVGDDIRVATGQFAEKLNLK